MLEAETKNQEQAKSKKTKLKKPPIVFEQTQLQLRKLGKILDCPVLSYFKPPNGNIWGQDLYAILECLKSTGPVDKLALYVRSNGGNGMVSLRMINLLRSFANKLIILAPSECASAATMLAMGCDEIYMGPLSSLSPVDSSLTHPLSPTDRLGNSVPISLDELWRVLRLWKEVEKQSFAPTQDTLKKHEAVVSHGIDKLKQIELEAKEEKSEVQNTASESVKNADNPYKYLYEYIHPLVFGAVDRYSSLSIRLCREILGYHMKDEELIDKISKSLNYDYPAHSYPITFIEAEKIGLPVRQISTEVQEILNRLQLLYSELSEEKITDYDNSTYHDHSIYSVVETEGIQLLYQQNYDKYYREAEKRYITMNDLSGWYKTNWQTKGKQKFGTERIFF